MARVTGVAGDPRPTTPPPPRAASGSRPTAGIDWKPIFDDQPISSIGSIAVAPSDPNVVYVGSGEANIRGNVAAGNGIYKSTDARQDLEARLEAGRARSARWSSIPRTPTSPSRRCSATPSARTRSAASTAPRDGGKTWQQVLFKDAGHRRVRRLPRPEQPAHRLRRPLADAPAAVGADQRRPGQRAVRVARRRRHLEASSTKDRRSGLPDGHLGQGRRGRRARRTGRRVYALIEAEKGGLFRSDDGGENWKLVNGDRALRQRAWYYSTLTVDPDEPRRGLVSRRCRCSRASTAARPSSRSRARTTATTTTSGSTRRTRRA